MQPQKPLTISRQSLQRMPIYLEMLKKLSAEGKTHISSALLAGELGLHPVQVRKDLAAVSSVDGNPRIGFALDGLIRDMEEFLGCNNSHEAVVAGVGNLGRALLSYRNFDKYGLKIIAGFDTDPAVIGTSIHDREIFHSSRITELCSRLGVHIGIITVPAEFAQDVCDRMISGGIRAIWNFAPVHLNLPDDVLITNENLAASFAALSSQLSQRRTKTQ